MSPKQKISFINLFELFDTNTYFIYSYFYIAFSNTFLYKNIQDNYIKVGNNYVP